MKKIDAIINPRNWEQTRAVLDTLHVSATLREVKTFGRVPPRREVYRGSQYTLETTPELELTVLVQDEVLESALLALGEATGNAELMVTPVEYFGRAREVTGTWPAAPVRRVAAARPVAAPLVAAWARG